MNARRLVAVAGLALALSAPGAHADDCQTMLVNLAGEADLHAVQIHSYNKLIQALDPTLTSKPLSDTERLMVQVNATKARDSAKVFADHLRAYVRCTTERWVPLEIDQVMQQMTAAQGTLDYLAAH